MKRDELKKQIIEILNSLNTDELVEIHNTYCSENYDFDGYPVYRTACDFDWYCEDRFNDMSPSEIAADLRKVDLIENIYFWETIYGLKTDDDNLPIYPEEIADRMIITGDAYGNKKIEELLDQYYD